MVDYQTGTTSESSALPIPERVLTIGAHPDDAEFGAGGTLAKWVAAGAHLTMLTMTDGSKGTWDPDMPRDALVTERLAEQRNAADALGGADVVTLGHVDGELEYSMALREQICGWIRQARPDVVLSHDPWRRYMLHPDHRATGWAVVDGVVAARDHLFFAHQLTGGMTHHRPSALLLWAADEPDHHEDIAGFVETKVAALLCHSTQATTTMGEAGETEEATAAFRAEIEHRARTAGAQAALAAAEAFKLIVP